MNDKCIEVEIENQDHKIEMTVFKNEMIKDIKKTIMNLYEYKNLNMFNIYLGSFHLNDYFDNMSIGDLNNKFVIEKLRVECKKSTILIKIGNQIEASNLNTQFLVNELQKNKEEIIKLNDLHSNMKYKFKEDERTEMKLNNYLKGLTNYNILNNDSISVLL